MPHFVIKNKFQKRSKLYQDILTRDILLDVCYRITGETSFTVEFDDSGYNVGRLAILEHENTVSFISFSEVDIASRNSSLQSIPSALVRYHQEVTLNKNIYFYFLPSNGGSIETDYFIFMYRLMKTAGVVFLNPGGHLRAQVIPFNSVQDIISQRNLNRGRNRSNNSTYVTIDEDSSLEIYGKTYGANKYETTLLCLAISELATGNIKLYEIQEGNLTTLPAPARDVILELGKIEIIHSDLSLERQEFEANDSLRSPSYIYNLLEKLGEKKCALCNCEIPQIIQGAHIWPVASIKKVGNVSQEQKLQSAIDGDNGIWLCNNHHKLFDINYLVISEDGRIKKMSDIRDIDDSYISDLTISSRVNKEILTPNFLQYLEKRNSTINGVYSFID